MTLEALLDKDAIGAVLTRLFVATDERDWAAVQACFDASVVFDMTSLGAPKAVTLSPAQIADAWRDGLRPIESVHHQVGNVRIDCVAVHGRSRYRLHQQVAASGARLRQRSRGYVLPSTK